jgi:hypothetical protein
MIKKKIFVLILLLQFASYSFCRGNGPKGDITVLSYLLRDRAVILDSLVMRKHMYFSFKSSLPLPKIKSSTVAGVLSCKGEILSRDTTYIFDEAAGNLGFCLPYDIPEGIYNLRIEIINNEGEILESYSGGYDRSELKPYFNSSIQFWDFTTPYAHLNCRGYGHITYLFNSRREISGLKKVEISGRMTTGNGQPGIVSLFLNDIPLGDFELPGGNVPKAIVNWRSENLEILNKVSINENDNRLKFALAPDTKLSGEGLRIYAEKNSTDPNIGNAVPLSIKITFGNKFEELTYNIPVWGGEGEHIISKMTMPPPKDFQLEKQEAAQPPLPLNNDDIRNGFVVFQKDFQRYVYPWTIPANEERIESLKLNIAQNDFEPLTFSIYPIRDLGKVRVAVSDFKGPGNRIIPYDKVKIYVVRSMKLRSGSENKYILLPRLLDHTNNTDIPLNYTTRFWMTIHSDSTTLPGKYFGNITISSEKEKNLTIPATLKVLPIKLEQVPGIEYSMCMSYEFFELESKDWSVQEKEKIVQDGVNTFKDYKSHGLTTVDICSPYYFQWNKDGTPRMDHFKAMIRGAKEVGFTNPIYWYFGHYVQSAKGKHPGSIRIWDPKVHPKRAKLLVETALGIVKKLNGPPVRFIPIDEPRIAKRKQIALKLFKEIKKIPGTVIMCTTDIGGKLLDIENNGTVDRKTLPPGVKQRESDRKVWEYNNAALMSENPAYTRYIYGYYTWRQDLDGMNSWGPGTTQNSRGNPFEDLDSEYRDVFIFYPHQGGSLPTPNWEALREGIDDVKYVYQLEKLCRKKSAIYPDEVSEAERFLDEIRNMCDFDERKIVTDFGDWTPERFDSIREEVTSWILKLQD